MYVAKLIDGIKTLVRPIQSARMAHGLQIISNLSFNKRINGAESISFTAIETDEGDFEEGGLYFLCLDRELQKPFPGAIILTQKRLIRGDTENYYKRYECTATSAEDLFYRRWLNVTYKSIKFRDLITKLLDQTRLRVPEISSDYSQIEDYDYTFVVFEKRNAFIGEIFEEIRKLGFSIYLDADLRVVAKHKSTNPTASIDIFRSTWNGKACLLKDSNISYSYKQAPVTSLMCKAGFATSGASQRLNVISNTEPTFDLETDVYFDEQFVFEPFDNIEPIGFTKINAAGEGWDKRYLVYDEPIEARKGLHAEIAFQVKSELGTSAVIGFNNGSNLEPENSFMGFVIEDQDLKIIANQAIVDTGRFLYSFEQKTVLAKEADLRTFELDSVANLNVGDRVNIAGLSSTLSAVNAEITAIDSINNKITIATRAVDGVIDGVFLQRVNDYVLRWTVTAGDTVSFYLKDRNGQFELLHSEAIELPSNFFVSVYSAFDGAPAVVDDGVWEVGNLIIDYFFLDKSNAVSMVDANDEKIYLCTSEQFSELADIDAVVNRITKNGEEFAQIEFISPSIVRTVYNNTGTSSRIPLVFQDSDFLKVGMRVLVNDKAYFITDFFKDLTAGYIDVTPALDPIPALDEEVYINTSIPATDSSFRISYLPGIRLKIRECAPEACANRFGFRERAVELPEYNNVSELAERALQLIEDECSRQISGAFAALIRGVDCNQSLTVNYADLPMPGSYVQVSDALQSISNELAEVQAVSINQVPGTDTFNVAVEFGVSKIRLAELTQNLAKKFGIFRGEGDTEFLDVPCVLRDSINIQDNGLTITESAGDDFLSGLYFVNLSGSGLSPAIESYSDIMTTTESAGDDFYSGLYLVNISGATA